MIANLADVLYFGALDASLNGGKKILQSDMQKNYCVLLHVLF